MGGKESTLSGSVCILEERSIRSTSCRTFQPPHLHTYTSVLAELTIVIGANKQGGRTAELQDTKLE